MSKIKQILIAFYVPLILAIIAWCIFDKYVNDRCYFSEAINGQKFLIYDECEDFEYRFLLLFVFSLFLIPIFTTFYVFLKQKAIKQTEIKLNG